MGSPIINGVSHTFDRGSVIAEHDKDEDRKARYIRGHALISRENKEGSKSYYLHNAHGDVTKVVDATGNVQSSYSYDAFGNTTAYTGKVENRFRYTGEQQDTITGQYYLRARYYDPAKGSFISEDNYPGQIEEPLSLNLYTYCINNPIKYIDPSGHWLESLHTIKTYDLAYEKFYDYIDENTDLSEEKNEALAREYATALAAGDQYVDDEKIIFKRKDFYYDGVFHGLNGKNLTENDLDKNNNPNNFINERNDTAGVILSNNDYSNYSTKDAIKIYIIDPAVTLLDDKTNASKSEIENIKNDITNNKVATTSPNAYMGTKETASLFVLGMGLHSLQDIEAHGMETSAHSLNDHNDETNWDYSKKTGWVEGNERITNTEEATRNYIGDFLNDYGSLLFAQYSVKSKK